MKIILTANEILAVARTFNQVPGIFKGFISDEKIMNKFMDEMIIVTSKTDAIKLSVEKDSNEFTIIIDEMFFMEVINEFGSMVHGIVAIIMSAGASCKRIADKYRKDGGE